MTQTLGPGPVTAPPGAPARVGGPHQALDDAEVSAFVRDQLAGGVLDVQYLRADKKFSRTRAILYSIIGVARLSKVHGELEAAHVRIESLSGAKPVAHDGEITEPKESVELAVDDRRLIVYRSRA